MKGKKHSFFIIRRGDTRLSEKITQQARDGFIFSSISPLGVITFVKGEPSEHIYRLENANLSKDLQLYDEEKYEEIFRSKSYVLFRSKRPAVKDVLEETASFEAWEYELETNWLSQKASEGFYLTRKSGDTYYFEKGSPEEYTYRIDFQIIKNPVEYLNKFKSSGWEYVCSSKNDHYFRRQGQNTEKHSVRPQVKALKKKIRFRWFIILWLFLMLLIGALFIGLGFFAKTDEVLKKILFYSIGVFMDIAAFSTLVGVMKGFRYLRKKNRLLKYRGE